MGPGCTPAADRQSGRWVSVARSGSHRTPQALEAQGYWANRPGTWRGSTIVLEEYQIGNTKFDNADFGRWGDPDAPRVQVGLQRLDPKA